MLNLTPRDRDCCDLLIQARSNREIGDRLGITEGSVKRRFHQIFLRNQIHLDPAKHDRIVLALLYYGEKKALLAAGS